MSTKKEKHAGAEKADQPSAQVDALVISTETLQQIGFNRIVWNNGAVIEYFISLHDNWDENYPYYKIAVRFGEFKNEDFRVWLFSAGAMTYCKGINTIGQIKQLYFLLKGKHL